MSEDITIQMLSQTTENIQKLFELSTRIDERLKVVQQEQAQLDHRIDEVISTHGRLLQKIAVLEAASEDRHVEKTLEECCEDVVELDKRVTTLETDKGRHNDRWNKIGSFLIQLGWVILAAYLLTKLHLQAPFVGG